MKKKLVLAALALLLLAFPAAWLQCREGVIIGTDFYIQKNPDLYAEGKNSVSITRTGHDAVFDLSINGTAQSVMMKSDGNRYSFQYEDGTMVEGFAGRWSDELVDEEGVPLGWTDGVAVYIGEEPVDDAFLSKYHLSNVLFRMHNGLCGTRGHALMIVMGLLLCALGIASILWPEKVYFFGSRWRYAHAELSADGIAVQKLTGIANIVLGIVLMYLPLFK